jgi:N-methylhydantoinase A
MTAQPVMIGVDVGGTFTDLVLIGQNGLSVVRKRLSTPQDYSLAIIEGVSAVVDEFKLEPASIVRFVHATTVATNTVIEGKGARTGLLCTAGFRDVIEMRRLRIPTMYDLQYEKPRLLVPRRLRFEVKERLNADGSVRTALDAEDVLAAARRFIEAGVESVAVAFLHSYANDEHERQAEQLLRSQLAPEVVICRSSLVLPEIREYERTSTAVVTAYVAPVIGRYLASLESRLRAIGVRCNIEIMHSAGGVIPIQRAIQYPAHLIESGPAAGVIASARIARLAGQLNVISFDMGGTTAKAAMIERGEPVTTTEYEVGAGINLSSKLVKGSGYPIKLPFIDVSEIGAGGGSIIRLGSHSQISVGPQSAGADPGPVCYGRGGTQATLCDALLVLGYINPVALAGNTFYLNSAAAHEALSAQLAAPLDKSLHEAAYGILCLAVATMTRAVKAVSTYRGRDPRDFILHAFGGNGAVVACEIARALGMQRVVVPRGAGVFSAFGLLYADVQQEAMRTLMLRAADLDIRSVVDVYRELEHRVQSDMRADGHESGNIVIRRQADMRYAGQAYELTVTLPGASIDLGQLVSGFHAEHERTYGHRSDSDPVEIVNIRVTGRLPSAAAIVDRFASREPTELAERQVFFGEPYGLRRTRIASRADLSISPSPGPLILEDYDATCVVPPDWSAALDSFGSIVIERIESSYAH